MADLSQIEQRRRALYSQYQGLPDTDPMKQQVADEYNRLSNELRSRDAPPAPPTSKDSLSGRMGGAAEAGLAGMLRFPIAVGTLGQSNAADQMLADAKQRIQESGGDPESTWGPHLAGEVGAGFLSIPGMGKNLLKGGKVLLDKGAALAKDPVPTFRAGGSKLMEMMRGGPKPTPSPSWQVTADEAIADMGWRPLTAAEEATRDLTKGFHPKWPPTKKAAPPSSAEPALGVGGQALRSESAASGRPTVSEPPLPKGNASFEGLTVSSLNPEVHKRIVTLSKDLFGKGDLPYNQAKRPSENIMDVVVSGKLPAQELDAALTRNGLTRQAFNDELLAPLHAEAGRTLQRLSVVQRLFGAQTPEQMALNTELKRLGLDLDDTMAATSWWRRLDNVRRGALVTQLSTAMRNFETQVGRVGLDVLQAPLDAGLQKALGKTQTVSPLDGLDQLLTIVSKRNPKAVDAILSAFPTQKDRLLTTYSSDLLAKAKAAGMPLPQWAQALDSGLSKAEGTVQFLNGINKAQEFFIRRGVFQAGVEQDLAKTGTSLTELIQRNAVGTIPIEVIQRNVDKALKATFAEQPAYGSVAANFIKLVNEIPGATFIIPFPRFLVNSAKFLFEYNPTGILKYLSKAERDAFAKGDVSTISKATLGTLMLGAAYQLRNSEYAGERWYEVKGPNNSTIDLRPFNPFASYLFLADVASRHLHGTAPPRDMDWNDVLKGVLSTNLRAGTGLYVMEHASDLVKDAWTYLMGGQTKEQASKATRRAKEFAGEAVGGFLTPLQQVVDLLGEFDQRYQVTRERRAEPFLGPIKSHIPGMALDLPETESPTRAGPYERPHPGIKQATGLAISGPKNAVEAELDRLGFNRSEILRPTGDFDYDTKRAQLMGPVVEHILIPIVQSEWYQSLSNTEKGVLLEHYLHQVRNAVTTMADTTLTPEERLEKKVKGQPQRRRALLEERLAR